MTTTWNPRFRGSRAAVPLKAYFHPERVSAGSRFRGSRAAVPLKGNSESFAGELLELPRLASRGPIEGHIFPASARRAGGRFRGSRAAVPLKARTTRIHRRGRHALPRLASRGPIEGGNAPMTRLIRSRFRGSRAAVPLKDHLPPCSTPPIPRFRGSRAAVPLKAIKP